MAEIAGPRISESAKPTLEKKSERSSLKSNIEDILSKTKIQSKVNDICFSHQTEVPEKVCEHLNKQAEKLLAKSELLMEISGDLMTLEIDSTPIATRLRKEFYSFTKYIKNIQVQLEKPTSEDTSKFTLDNIEKYLLFLGDRYKPFFRLVKRYKRPYFSINP